MTQLTIKGFPKFRPNITLERIIQYIARNPDYEEPGNKELRLAIDLAKQRAPEVDDINDIVRDIIGENIPDSKINNVKSFKKITKKKVIVPNPSGDGVRIIQVIRKRKK